MRKRRNTVYVTPGKDVTLYVPADTPPIVIDYLNRLKAEGQFSQGVMEILIQHVTDEQRTESMHQHGEMNTEARYNGSYRGESSRPVHPSDPRRRDTSRALSESSHLHDSVDLMSSHDLADSADLMHADGLADSDHLGDSADVTNSDDLGGTGHPGVSAGVRGSFDSSNSFDPSVSAVPTSLASASSPEPSPSKQPFHLKMADIFRQAQKNTGRITDSPPGSDNT